MRAAYVHQPGPADTILIGDMPTPSPGVGQCLVRVAVSAVNPIDTYVRSGLVAMNLPLPYIPGSDLAGVVEAVGEGVTRFAVGDRVWGSNQGLLGRQGTLAEYAAVDADLLYPIPSGVSDEVAAAGALVGITAHLGLVRESQLKAGETILVVGGSGGVGSTVVQLAKALGAHVITTAGCDDRAKIARDAGADELIDYTIEDIGEAAKRLAPSGVNVWWDTRREPDLAQAVGAAAERGRIVVMAGRDAKPQIPIGPFYVKGCHLLGFAMFKATADEQRAAAEELNRWLVSGEYHPRIAKTFALKDAAVAHALQEAATIDRSATLGGKIIVKP